MTPKLPLVVSHYTDHDDRCGIVDDDNSIVIPLLDVTYKERLEFLVRAANAARLTAQRQQDCGPTNWEG